MSGDARFQRQQADGSMEMRELGTLTRDLLVLSDWLTEAGITYVAMEGTDKYWKSASNLVYGALTAFLVNDTHVKQMAGTRDGVGRGALAWRSLCSTDVAPNLIPSVAPRNG